MLTSLLWAPNYFHFLLLGLFSLLIGSLLNVVIYRLPLMMQREWKAQCQSLLNLGGDEPSRVNLFFPRSFCPQCETTIPFWHNIPVLSYCFLAGRCHQCRHPISLRYPLVELLTLALSLLAAWHFGFSYTLVFALLFIWILIAITFIDLDHQLLPDSLSLSLLWLGLITNTEGVFTSLPNAVLSASGAYLFLWLFIQLFYLVTGKVGMGNGDFKLFAAFGAWFGWTMLPFILVLSSLLGAIVGAIYLFLTKKGKETPIPFGPFLCLGGLGALFFGPQLVAWYVGSMSFVHL